MSRKENFCQWMSILAGASSRLRAYRLPSQCHFVHSVAYSITAQIDRPPYLTNLLMYQPSHCLHSASQNLLSIPFCTTNFSKRSFSFSAPTIWNELLTVIRESNTLDTFKFQGLKTHLTSLNYPQHITTSAARRLPAPQIRLDLTTTVHITNSSIDWLTCCRLTDSFRQFLPAEGHSKQVTDRCQVSLHCNSARHS